MTLNEPFYVRLQRAMADRGITQAQLARRLHVGRTYVNHWYWGINQPSIEKLREIKRALRCEWDVLLGR